MSNPQILIYGTVLMMSVLASVYIFLIVVWSAKSKQHNKNLQKLKDEKERQLLKASIESQENERKRIASDLHDGIAPLLSALKLEINAFDSGTSINELNEKLNETINELRSVSHKMSSAVLEQLGLSEAIQSIIVRFGKISAIKLNCKWNNEIENHISKQQSLHIYRIIQEALNNIIKHSKAKNVNFIGSISEAEISIEISDDGIGFEFQEDELIKGIGLNSIAARCELLGAKKHIVSNKTGTTISLKLDIKDD